MYHYGVNQVVQKENNLSLILHYLIRNRSCTRVWLSQETGLTQAAVGKHISQLMEWGMVTESEGVATGNGRRPLKLELNGQKYRSIAIRINRDYITCAIYDMLGKQYVHKYISISPEEGAAAALSKMLIVVGELIERSDIKPICIGVAVAGPYNRRTGRIVLMSGFPGWEDIDIKYELENAFSIQTFVEHDANCGALAENWFGNYPPGSNIIFIAADKGIGAGMVINGKIYQGRDGFAGEFGHSSINVFGPRCECGNNGCLELYGTINVMLRSYTQQVCGPMGSGIDPAMITDDYFINMVKSGEPTAVEIYRNTVSYLGFGVVGLINTMSPDAVIFSDKIIFAKELFLDTIKTTLKRYLMRDIYNGLEIRTSLPEIDSILLGASVIAFDNLLQNPSASFKNN